MRSMLGLKAQASGSDLRAEYGIPPDATVFEAAASRAALCQARNASARTIEQCTDGLQ